MLLHSISYTIHPKHLALHKYTSNSTFDVVFFLNLITLCFTYISFQFKTILVCCILLFVIAIVRPSNADRQYHHAEQIIYSRHKRSSGDFLGKIKHVSARLPLPIVFTAYTVLFPPINHIGYLRCAQTRLNEL